MSGSLAASARASHRRQVGRHAAAQELDERALLLADTDEERADATSGLVADALGVGDSDRAFALLPAARQAAVGWRGRIRLGWVVAELSLLVGELRTAVAEADEALTAARLAGAPRHVTKSLLVRGVARHVAGDRDGALDLLTALEQAQAAGLTSLVWPAALVAAAAVPGRGDALRSVAAVAAASIVAGLGTAGPAFAARPDVAELLKHRRHG
jgi:hypothetical protein